MTLKSTCPIYPVCVDNATVEMQDFFFCAYRDGIHGMHVEYCFHVKSLYIIYIPMAAGLGMGLAHKTNKL